MSTISEIAPLHTQAVIPWSYHIYPLFSFFKIIFWGAFSAIIFIETVRGRQEMGEREGYDIPQMSLAGIEPAVTVDHAVTVSNQGAPILVLSKSYYQMYQVTLIGNSQYPVIVSQLASAHLHSVFSFSFVSISSVSYHLSP